MHDTLVTLNFGCCSGSGFTARTHLAAAKVHVAYHGTQYRKGRRSAPATILTKPKG